MWKHWRDFTAGENMGEILQYVETLLGLNSMCINGRDFTIDENMGETLQYMETLAGLYSMWKGGRDPYQPAVG